MLKKIVSLLVCMLLFVGCGPVFQGKNQGEMLEIFYFNPQENNLVREEIPFSLEENAPREQQITAVMGALYKGPQSNTLQGTLPPDLSIKEVNLKDKIAYVTFSNKYKDWEISKQIMVRGSLVYSLTALDFIEGVNFFVEDVPLMNANGEVLDTMYRSDFLVSALNPKPPTNTQVITLYFGKTGEDKLYPEKREIQINNNVPIERYILEEIIKGPQTEGLVALLPAETKINAIQTQDKVCQVDLSYDWKLKPAFSPMSDKLIAYAIVNALTESSRVQKVSFLVEGKKPTDVIGSIDFNNLLERDDELIAKESEETISR